MTNNARLPHSTLVKDKIVFNIPFINEDPRQHFDNSKIVKKCPTSAFVLKWMSNAESVSYYQTPILCHLQGEIGQVKMTQY